MAEKVPLFNSPKGSKENNKQEEQDMDPDLDEDLYRGLVLKRWFKIIAILVGAINLILLLITGILLVIAWPSGLSWYEVVYQIVLASIVDTVFLFLPFIGFLILAYSIYVFTSRLLFRTKVWSTPLGYLDNTPGETVRSMNSYMSRNTKNFDVLYGFIIGLVLIIPYLLRFLIRFLVG